MVWLRSVALGCSLSCLLLGTGCVDNNELSGSPAGGSSVRIEPVTFKELEEKIASYKGKVVVVDVWATWCGPCRAEFHNLVDLHRQKADDGVVCLSVAVDCDARDARKFLALEGAVFPNYLLDEEESARIEHAWGFDGIPAVFVFDQEGRRHSYAGYRYTMVRRGVSKLLAKK